MKDVWCDVSEHFLLNRWGVFSLLRQRKDTFPWIFFLFCCFWGHLNFFKFFFFLHTFLWCLLNNDLDFILYFRSLINLLRLFLDDLSIEKWLILWWIWSHFIKLVSSICLHEWPNRWGVGVMVIGGIIVVVLYRNIFTIRLFLNNSIIKGHILMEMRMLRLGLLHFFFLFFRVFVAI